MNDPTRAFVEAAREEFEPTRADRERVKRHLGARLAGAALAGSAAATATAATPAGASLAGHSLLALGKLFLTTVVVTVASGTAVVGASRAISRALGERRAEVSTPTVPRASGKARPAVGAHALASPTTLAPPPMPSVSAQAVVSFAEARAVAPVTEARAAHSTPKPRGPAATLTRPANAAGAVPALPDPSAHALDAELALLERAKRASAGGDFADALAILAQLDRDQAAGALLEERAVLRIVISCKMGESEGPQRVAAFARRYTHSVYMARLASACAIPAPGSDAPNDRRRATSSVTDPSEVAH